MSEDNLSDKGQRSLQLTVLAVLILLLWFLAMPQYLQLVDKTSLTKAEASLNYLQQAQTMYYGIYGRYASTIDELDVESPGLKEALGRKDPGSGWSYSVRLLDDSGCELVASRARPKWLNSAPATVVKRIGS